MFQFLILGLMLALKSIITLENVKKKYAANTVLNDISCSFKENQTVAIIGKSGSGKSTLLRCINGMVIPESGSISVFGKRINYDQLPELRQKIGYAVQGVGLFPHLNIQDNITILAKLRNWTKSQIEDRLNVVFELTQLEMDLLQRYPDSLSGGQQQRVGLARALFLDPDILLLDEPFGALDPLTKLDVQSQFLNMKSALQKTVVIVTHDMDEAIKLSDQIIIIDNGEIRKTVNTKQMIIDLNGKSPNSYLLELLQ